MAIRTFIQEGRGYGADPVEITAKINGVVVYQGPVDTVDEPLPPLPGLPSGSDTLIFSWERPIDFSGSVEMEITVGNGTLLLTDSFANYTPKLINGQTVTSGPDEYLPFYVEKVGDVVYTDPMQNPKIDGVDVVRDRNHDPDDPLDGQWCYVIGAGSVFTSTVLIAAGEPDGNV